MTQRSIIFFILFFVSVKAQTLIYVADSLTGVPIEDVFVSDSVKNTITDKNGFFNLDLFQNSDSLKFRHVNYSEKKLSFDEVKSIKKIILTQKIFLEDEITIKDKQSEYNSKQTIEVLEKLKLTKISSADLLESGSTLIIKDYGGRGALKTVSAKGLSSENTVVLFNEAKVNDISTGGFDFSKLSSVSIDKIEYLKSSSEEETSAGGIVKLFSGNFNNSNSKSVGIKYGSENYQSFFTIINQTFNKFSFQVKGERSYSPNDFKYNFEKKELNRTNAFFNKSFISANANYSDSRNVLRFYVHYSYLNSGIPGYVVTNNYNSSSAVNKNTAYLPILNYNYKINNELLLQTSFHSHFQKLVLYDEQENLVLNDDTKDSDLYDGSISTGIVWENDKLSASLKYQFEYGELRNRYFRDTQKRTEDFAKRLTNNLTASAQYSIEANSSFIETINLGSTIKVSSVNENFSNIENTTFANYSFNVGLIPNFINEFSIGVSYSKNNRPPTFNERYYSNLFDKAELRNEKYTSFDFGINYKKNQSEISFNIYKIWGTDRIIWVPTRLALQTPKNIGKIETDGIELTADQNLFKNILNLNLLYTYTNAVNKSESTNSNSYNKQIVYIPKHKFRSSISISLYNFLLKTDFSFTSESFFTSDNNPYNRLGSYFIIDQSIIYDFKIFGKKSTAALTIYNLFDEQYLTVQSYPMPLRSFTISFLYNIN